MTDINLTGQIAANLVEALKQPWYSSPLIIAGLGGLLTLAGVWVSNKNAEKREERNRNEETQRIRREERKNAYIHFLTTIFRADTTVRLINAGAMDDSQFREWAKEFQTHFTSANAEIALIDYSMYSKIQTIIEEHKKDEKSVTKIIEECNSIIVPLMQKELIK